MLERLKAYSLGENPRYLPLASEFLKLIENDIVKKRITVKQTTLASYFK